MLCALNFVSGGHNDGVIVHDTNAMVQMETPPCVRPMRPGSLQCFPRTEGLMKAAVHDFPRAGALQTVWRRPYLLMRASAIALGEGTLQQLVLRFRLRPPLRHRRRGLSAKAARAGDPNHRGSLPPAFGSGAMRA
eukprot:CAMPEP_0170252518 /NCGR_PEP_ID=MMETSP0116_2-20130129/26093_1 /TAXON_ID=400756 /ORGANISM="Durinskia baltica, Strain CSIRO CS-38" /LENGTH=134 /DNA_ID=CAMNT_0010503489 /DNA_START=662 /DNA_END=1066 /DNA_ORIENTATION=+